MNRCVQIVLLPLCILLTVSGCKQEPKKKPDHVIQQEAREKEKALAAKKAKAAQAKKPKKSPEEKKKDLEDHGWPGPVRLAFYSLYTAQITQWPAASRRLALLGLPAVPAMKRLLKNKRQPVKKKALLSFLYVQLHMFRPEALTMMARDEDMPFARRGAIEALSAIGNDQTKKSLTAIVSELKAAPPPKAPPSKTKGHAGHDHASHAGRGHGASGPEDKEAKKRPFGPIIDFIVRAQKNPTPWGYNASQLAVLDSVFHAESQMKLKVAMDWIKDDAVEDGMLAILRSPVTRPPIHTSVIKRLIELAANKTKKFKDYCEPGFPQMLRMLAAKKLLDQKKTANRKYLEQLARNQRDPIAPFLNAILSGKQPAMTPPRFR